MPTATTSGSLSCCATYADLRVGFVDAAVLAVVERLRETKLATLDHRRFSVMRPGTSTRSNCCPRSSRHATHDRRDAGARETAQRPSGAGRQAEPS